MAYDGIHNITNKTQRHVSLGNNGNEKVIAGTSYDWAYSYKDRGHSQPHAPTHIGNRKFDYDLNGNLTQWTHDQNGSRRSLNWDEENRIHPSPIKAPPRSYTMTRANGYSKTATPARSPTSTSTTR